MEQKQAARDKGGGYHDRQSGNNHPKYNTGGVFCAVAVDVGLCDGVATEDVVHAL